MQRCLLGLMLLAACSSYVAPVDPLTKACEGVVCGHGHCVLDGTRPACWCDPDFKPLSLSCVPVKVDPPDPCLPNPCTQQHRTTCAGAGATARCSCDPGTYEQGATCLIQTPCSPNPCAGVNQTACTVVGAQAVCSCNTGYAPEGAGCSVDKVFDCTQQHVGDGADPFEPDECPTLAPEVLPDAMPNLGRTIFPVGDVDWMVFGASAGHVYAVRVTGTGGLSLAVDVYANDGATTVGFDHLGSASSAALFKATSADPHFIRVRPFRANETGPYTVMIEDLGVDDYPDSPASATPAAVGGSMAGDLQFPGDLDVVRIPLPSGNSYSLGSDAGFAGLMLELIGADKTTVLRTATAGETTIITHPALSTDYYLRVSSGSSSALGHFDFQFDNLGIDDHGDVPAEATPLTPSSTLTAASFERRTDVDCFSFTATIDHIYSFTCNPGSGGYYGCLSSFIDANGVVLSSSGSGYNSTALSHEFAQAGTFYVRASPQYSYSATATPYTFKLEDLGLDDFGDDPSTASPIIVGAGAKTGRIETLDDKDVFSFTTVASHIYRFNSVAGAGLGSCGLRILNASGAPLVTNATTGSATSVAYEASTGGTLYAEVGTSGYSGATGTYTFSLEDLGLDDYGDTPATATGIIPSSIAALASLEFVGDVDVFSFAAATPNIYRFTCSSSVFGCTVRLKTLSGAILQTNSNYSGDSVVSYEPLSSGTYYVEVSSSSYGGASGSYTWKLENIGPDDVGDTLGTAEAITVSTTFTTRSLETPTDLDVFSFSATAGEIYKFTCTTTGYYGCTAAMKNPSGTIVASSSGSSSSTSIGYEASVGGTYSIEVSASASNWVPTTYSFKLEDVGVDDHGDTIATATAIFVPTAATSATLEWSGDIDVFSFPTVTGHLYRFSCGNGTLTSCSLTFKDAAGTSLATSSSAPVSVTYKAAASQYYVAVSTGSYYGASGTYTYQLEDLGLDDHGDTPATATGLPGLNVAVSGQLEYAADVDYFSISLAASTSYQVLATGAYVYLSVFGTNGVTPIGYETSSPLNFTTASAGTYYVRVRYPYGSSSGGYQILVK